jgi:hypothetical protein
MATLGGPVSFTPSSVALSATATVETSAKATVETSAETGVSKTGTTKAGVEETSVDIAKAVKLRELPLHRRGRRHRRGCLRAGLRFTWSWTRRGRALGSVDVRTEADAVILMFSPGGAEGNRSKSVEQRVPFVWTLCHLGGARPWFRCSASVGGRPCRRRVAKLYLRDAAIFACRQCCGLTYASQREIPRYRAISRVQKIRMRLGGSANLLKPFPKKPRGMHRWTYYRLPAKAMAAQERSIALELDYMRRHYPGLLSQENLVGS